MNTADAAPGYYTGRWYTQQLDNAFAALPFGTTLVVRERKRPTSSPSTWRPLTSTVG